MNDPEKEYQVTPPLRPDIVLIHCHDLGRWLNIYGMPNVPSPNIARFAERSIVYENAHSAAPLCSPARGALFTGLSPYVNGIQGLAHNAWRYRENVLTAPERLRPFGYHSALIGLQHENVDPTVLGFDECPGQGFLPRVNQVVEAAEDWLCQLPSTGDRDPLFLTVGTWEVHRPWPSDDYIPADPRNVDVPAYLPDTQDTRADIADFYGAISQFDDGFGRLIAAIDRALDPSNTLIVFTTDHGAAFPGAKSTLRDSGTGVTLVVRPPDAWAVEPRRVANVVSHMDVVPTLIQVAGGNVPTELEGVSLLPTLAGESDGDPDRLVYSAKDYHDTYDPKRAVRSKSFVYIRNYEPGPRLQLAIDLEKSKTRRSMGNLHLEPRPEEEFYDRSNDPAEMHNRSEEPEYAIVKAEYAAALHEWLERIGDPIETKPTAPAPARSRATDPLPAAQK